MKLIISQLKVGDNPLEFYSSRDSWLQEVFYKFERSGYEVEGDIWVDMNLTKLDPDYTLRGKLKFIIQQACFRCAENFPLSIDHRFHVAFAHTSEHAKIPSVASHDSDELDINFFQGNEIDLAPVIEEQFVLSLPYQAPCKSDCRGICQRCGTNLNLGSCQCDEIPKATPFEVLKNWKH